MTTSTVTPVTPETRKPVQSVTEVNPLTSQQIVYVKPESVLNEVSMTLVDRLTELAKDKFAREIMAGHATDKDLAQFRVSIVNDLVKTAHKGMIDRRKLKDEQKSLTFYRELIARGMSQAEAIKLAKL